MVRSWYTRVSNQSIKTDPEIFSTTQTPGTWQGAQRVTGEAPGVWGNHTELVDLPDPEVAEKNPRRRFIAKYKLRILHEADNGKEPGQPGTLLRRKGLYSSNLTTWRRQREKGILSGLTPKKRGRKIKPKNP